MDSAANTHKPSPFTRLITTNTASSGSNVEARPQDRAPGPAVGYHERSGPGEWQHIGGGTFFSLVYSADARPTLDARDGEADVKAHEARHDAGELGLVNSAGSVCRMVEWAPLPEGDAAMEAPLFMHRTESLDYGIVLAGEIELTVPSQPPRILKAGDICVQRGTMHAWRNVSRTQPARMAFVLIATDKLLGPDGQPLPDYHPPVPADVASQQGVPEGQRGSQELMKAKRT